MPTAPDASDELRSSDATVTLPIGPRSVWVLAAVGVGLLVLALLAPVASASLPGFSAIEGMFDVDDEQSLFTWYSASLLALGGLLALAMAAVERTDRTHWRIIGALLLLASVDEVASGHERIAFLLRALLDVPLFAWVVPAAAVSAVAVALGIPFARRLDPALRRGLGSSVVVYLGGALVLETLSGLVLERDGALALAYRAGALLEETAEVAGVLILIATLLAALGRRRATCLLRLGHG